MFKCILFNFHWNPAYIVGYNYLETLLSLISLELPVNVLHSS